MRVTRMFVAILIALSFVSSPAPALAAPQSACDMSAHDFSEGTSSEKMSCCDQQCAAPCPPAVVPPVGTGAAALPPVEPAWELVSTSAPSSTLGAADPPPRTFFI